MAQPALPASPDVPVGAVLPRERAKLRAARLALAVGVFLVALLIRWPEVTHIPALTDEGDEIRLAARISRGEILPLRSSNSHIGIVVPYITALAMHTFGINLLVGRGVIAVIGSLLAGVTAWLAWGMAGQLGPRGGPPWLAALGAGLLIATSFPLVVFGSHVAWSNNTTAFFSTAALSVTYASVIMRRPARVMLAGALWGLTLQTHPASVVMLPGCILWALGQRDVRTLLRTRWVWLGVAAFLLAYSNMIWFNLVSSGQSLSDAADPRRTFGVVTGLGEYASRLGLVVLQLGRMLAGAYLPFDRENAPLLLTVAVPLYGLIAALALVWTARRSVTLILPMTILGALLTLPLVSDGFLSLYQTRFLAPCLPLLYVALGLRAAALWASPPGRLSLASSRTRAAYRAVLALGLTVLISWPLVEINRFYTDTRARGLTNEPYLAIAQAARVAADSGALVLMDKDSDDIKLGGGGGHYRAIITLMELDGTPHQVVRLDKLRYYLAESEAPLFLILGDKQEAELIGHHPLTPTGAISPSYRVYTMPAPR